MPSTLVSRLVHLCGHPQYRLFLLGLLVGMVSSSGLGLILMSPASSVTRLEQLSSNEQSALRSGQVLVSGSNGIYVSKVLISAPLPVVWGVLTDYNRLPRVLPGVVSLRVLESNGNRKVIEQVDSRQVLLVQIRSRLRTQVTEVFARKRIDFQLLEGDLQEMQGYWQLEPISTAPEVLLTQQIVAQPKGTIPKSLFYDLFKTSLAQNFSAIRAEAERRVNQNAAEIR